MASTVDNGECEICFDNPVEVAIGQCGHQFCADCVRQVQLLVCSAECYLSLRWPVAPSLVRAAALRMQPDLCQWLSALIPIARSAGGNAKDRLLSAHAGLCHKPGPRADVRILPTDD